MISETCFGVIVQLLDIALDCLEMVTGSRDHNLNDLRDLFRSNSPASEHGS